MQHIWKGRKGGQEPSLPVSVKGISSERSCLSAVEPGETRLLSISNVGSSGTFGWSCGHISSPSRAPNRLVAGQPEAKRSVLVWSSRFSVPKRSKSKISSTAKETPMTMKTNKRKCCIVKEWRGEKGLEEALLYPNTCFDQKDEPRMGNSIFRASLVYLAICLRNEAATLILRADSTCRFRSELL